MATESDQKDEQKQGSDKEASKTRPANIKAPGVAFKQRGVEKSG